MQRLRYLCITVLLMALWDNVLIKPLKIFSVFLHELGHTLMAFIFGNGIQRFNVNFDETGYVLASSNGWFSSFMIANGGYLGSVLFAILILRLKKTSFKKYILGSLAILFFAISINYAGFSRTLLFSIIFACAIIIIHMAHNEKVTDWAIDILGISSVTYAIYDTFVDNILLWVNNTFSLSNLFGYTQKVNTDLMTIQNLTHIPSIVWGILWLAISILAINLTLLKTKVKIKK